MSAVRQQIRERIVVLCQGLTTTGNRVFDSRVYNFSQTTLPALAVYALSENSERDAFQSTDGLARTVDVMVEGYTQQTEELEDTLDTISAEVETAVAADPTLNGKAKDTFLSNTEISLTGEGDLPMGVIRMTWTVSYRTKTTLPETPY